MATLYCCDNDDYPEAEKKYGINAFPTFKFYRNGEENEDFIQGADWRLIEEKIKKLYDDDWWPEYVEKEETPKKPEEGDEEEKKEGEEGKEGDEKKDDDEAKKEGEEEKEEEEKKEENEPKEE